MLASNVPTKVSVPFANSGTKSTIPVASQIGVNPGAASFTDGFVPLNFTPKISGGIPPFGADFNGILNFLSASIRWINAGGSNAYDAAFSTAISGYPAGAQVQRIDGTGFWLNTIDGNATNPEIGGAGWVPMNNYGITALTGLTNSNVTLTALQYARPVITLSGVLTSNVQIIFPTTLQEWLVVNNTTGAFTLTCTTSGGTGAVVAQAGGQQTFWGDGTNLRPLAGNGALPLNVGPATASNHAVNLGQFTSSLATNGYRTFPDGTIEQWGIFMSNSSADVVVTFPTPFLLVVYGIVCSQAYTPGTGIVGYSNMSPISLTQMQGRSSISGNGTYWRAYGR